VRDGQRLSRQRGLIHFYRITFQQSSIRRRDVAQMQIDYIAQIKLTRFRVGYCLSRFT
jgi:hypothetical protein